jgi:hypothetical protein
MLETPVAIFCFNRPAETKRLFQILETVRPTRLLIVADGPRPGVLDDVEKCNEVLAILRNPPWDCTVEFDIAPRNLGLLRRFSSGLEWVFNQSEKAIILEDDCLPDISFFSFASEMLFRYELDLRVGMIQGWSAYRSLPLKEDYYLTSRPKVWGWASWKRVVENFDVNIPFWPGVDKEDLILRQGFYKFQVPGVIDRIETANAIDTWDYQWVAYLWSEGLKSVAPKKSLVRNIGFGPEASHTKVDFGGYSQNALTLNAPFSQMAASDSIGRALDRLEFWAQGIRMLGGILRSPSVAIRLVARRFSSPKKGQS